MILSAPQLRSNLFACLPVVIFLLFCRGCIEKFYPEEDNLKTGTLVINAHITDHPGWQEIEVSRSTTLIYSEHTPLDGCYVCCS